MLNSRRRGENMLNSVRKNKEPFSERIMQEDEEDAANIQNLGVEEITAMVLSEELMSKFNGTKLFGNIGFIQTIPFENMLQSAAIPRIASFLSNPYPDHLQMEAASTIANVVWKFPKITPAFVNLGVIPVLVSTMSSTTVSETHKIKAVTALNNISAYSMETRNSVLTEGAMLRLCSQIYLHNTKTIPSVIYILSHTLRTLCHWRLQDREDLQELLCLVMSAVTLLIHSREDIIVSKGVSALASLANQGESFVNAIIFNKNELVPELIKLLDHDSSRVVEGTLRCLTCMTAHCELQTQVLINASILNHLKDVFTTRMAEKFVMRNFCKMLSNISAGGIYHIHRIITAGFIPDLRLLLKNADFWVRREAIYALTNAVVGSSCEQVSFFVRQGIIEDLCQALTCSDLIASSNCLEAIEKILSSGRWKSCSRMIIECGGMDKIVRLRNLGYVEISDKCNQLLHKYLDIVALCMLRE